MKRPGKTKIGERVGKSRNEIGLKLQSLQVRSADEFQFAYSAMSKEHASALIIIRGSFTGFHREQLFELATRRRIPSMCDAPNWAEDGCLMSYGSSRTDMYRRAATYVDKILKGAKPARLAGRTTHEIRVRHQSENRQADRPDDSAKCAGAGGQSH